MDLLKTSFLREPNSELDKIRSLNLKILLAVNIHKASHIQVSRSSTHCFSITVLVYITEYVLSTAQSKE